MTGYAGPHVTSGEGTFIKLNRLVPIGNAHDIRDCKVNCVKDGKITNFDTNYGTEESRTIQLRKEFAEQQLDSLDEKWGKKYPVVITSWRNNWAKLSTYFKYDPSIRKLIYTTNTIEGFHRQVRKVTKTKGAFP